jgi:L-alanine-DL-glutamate epimerase-like enolase superfamily enzyme
LKICSLSLLPVTVPLSRPYAVATYATDAVRLVRVGLVDAAGRQGFGSASPEPQVTHETFADCLAALQGADAWLCERAFTTPRDLAPTLAEHMPRTPAARAALDRALHDLWGKANDRAVVDLLGRVHHALPTSVTIGVRDVAATLAEAQEHVARGFCILKVKTGVSVDLDIERCVRLRECLGPGLPLLVDANVGYTFAQLRTFLERTRALDLQLVEQPLLPADSHLQHTLGAHDIARLCADESLHDAVDAARLTTAARAFGAWNIKLMKCGGITPALDIARHAQHAGIGLMWGCMDESVIGIAAALHAAFACPATCWLDLDGSFDLAHDVASGGFQLRDGRLRTLDRPGLGVEAIDA